MEDGMDTVGVESVDDQDHREERDTGRPLELRAKLAIGGILLSAVFYVVLGTLVVTMPSDAEIALMSDADYEALRTRTAILSDETTLMVVENGLRLFSGVLFWLWMFRAYTNLRALGREPEHEPSRAVWSWFVPVANLWWPYQIMAEIWRKSAPRWSDHSDDDDDASHLRAGAPLVMDAWWGLWVVRLMLDRVLAKFDDSVAAFSLYVVLTLVGAALAVVVIQRVTARQEHALQGGLESAVPTTF
jgi:hypothetical protein